MADWSAHKLKCNQIRLISSPKLSFYIYFLLLLYIYIYIYININFFDITKIHEKKVEERRKLQNQSVQEAADRFLQKRNIIDAEAFEQVPSPSPLTSLSLSLPLSSSSSLPPLPHLPPLPLLFPSSFLSYSLPSLLIFSYFFLVGMDRLAHAASVEGQVRFVGYPK